MWVPDVYQGAPTAVTLLVGGAPKLAAFAIMVRLLVGGMLGLAADWQQMLMMLSVLSMLIGNLARSRRRNLKRMLAYSTIAQMGFMLLGLAPAWSTATPSRRQRLQLVDVLHRHLHADHAGHLRHDHAAVARTASRPRRSTTSRAWPRRSPWFAGVMPIFMFSLAGMPPTVGFYAKLAVLQPLVSTNVGYIWLAVVAVVLSLIGAFYYLRIVKLMYFDDAGRHARRSRRARLAHPALAQRHRGAAARHPAGRPDGGVRAGDRADVRDLSGSRRQRCVLRSPFAVRLSIHALRRSRRRHRPPARDAGQAAQAGRVTSSMFGATWALPDGSDPSRVHRPSRRGDGRADPGRWPPGRRAAVALSAGPGDARISCRQARRGEAGARLRGARTRGGDRLPRRRMGPRRHPAQRHRLFQRRHRGLVRPRSPGRRRAARRRRVPRRRARPASTSSTTRPAARRTHRRQDADRPALVAELACRPLAARMGPAPDRLPIMRHESPGLRCADGHVSRAGSLPKTISRRS